MVALDSDVIIEDNSIKSNDCFENYSNEPFKQWRSIPK